MERGPNLNPAISPSAIAACCLLNIFSSCDFSQQALFYIIRLLTMDIGVGVEIVKTMVSHVV